MVAPALPMLKFLRRSSVRLIKGALALCQVAATVANPWRREPVLDAWEAERLDRIRNPSKYLGKS
jgi:hypothetical protein